MIVRIDKLSHDMRGITRIDNKITFVDKTLPNEVVNIRLTKQKRILMKEKLFLFWKRVMIGLILFVLIMIFVRDAILHI